MRSGSIFDPAAKSKRIVELDAIAAKPEFWNNSSAAQDLLRERSLLQADIDDCEKLNRSLSDAKTLLELADEAQDDTAAAEASDAAKTIEQDLGRLELQKVLSEPHDQGGAILSINAGAGGTESQDWAAMLLRMYVRWCARRQYKTETIDELPGDEAGLKSVTISAQGPYAYGFLRAEVGVHRLVRISPFDAASRRHTSFASVWVYPDIEEDTDVEVADDEIEIEYFKASGPGGQHVNKTESAVRIRHTPTGIVVQCQSERSQHKNKSQAMRVLRARILEQRMREKEEEMDEQRAQKKAINFGSQIRSYVMAPYRLVSDHRTELKVGNVDKVLDGDLDGFIQAFHFKVPGGK